MSLNRPRLWSALAASICAVTIALSLSSVAGAFTTSWVSPFNVQETYYMPGPPPGTYQYGGGCLAGSLNGGGTNFAEAYLYPWNNVYSICTWGVAQVVFAQGGSVFNGPATPAGRNLRSFSAVGGTGVADIGGNFGACSTNGLCRSWQTSWIT